MTIKICVVGGGCFGEMHLQAFTQLHQEERCQFAAMADLSPAIREKRAAEFGVKTYADHREMIATEQPDVVTIATPDSTHMPIAIDALEAGCHVLVEKPMDVTVEGCGRMVNLAREKDLLLQVDFHKRYDPYHLALRQAILDGKVGTPLYGHAWMEDRVEVPTKWFPGWAPKSSPAWFLGSHMVDLFQWLLGGKRATRVFATGTRKCLRSMGIDTLDSVLAKIEFEDDFSLSLNTSWILPNGFEAIVNQGIRLVGSDGIVEIDSQDRGAGACFSGQTQCTFNLEFKQVKTDKWGRPVYEGYGYDSITDVVENVTFLKQGGKLADLAGKYPSGEDGLEVTRILCAMHDSIESGQLVEL